MSTWGNHPWKKVGFDKAPNVQFGPLSWSNCQAKKKMVGPSFSRKKKKHHFFLCIVVKT
jgi:hypothetical protein